ncbi:MAG: hypothetical protein Q9159_006586 [Coniocarpon cinnabarinum]
MKIVIVQLDARLGAYQYNLGQAEELLKGINATHVDLLVLPELAFSGYNFPSLEAIHPHLEPTAAGKSTRWAVKTAKRLQCTVTIGYPELHKTDDPITSPVNPTIQDYNANDFELDPSPAFPSPTGQKRFNSTVTVGPDGKVVAHYRKSFLFTTDETWAAEGPGFYAGTWPLEAPLRSQRALHSSQNGNGVAKAPGQEGMTSQGTKTTRVAHGICMDINPYKFQTPWETYEYATHCKKTNADLVLNVNAFLTSHNSVEAAYRTAEELAEEAAQPDTHTLAYWIARMRPLVESEKEVVVVCANRTGREGDATYAGTSTVMRMGGSGGGGGDRGEGEGGGNVSLWGVLGKGEAGVLRVDTEGEPRLRMVAVAQQEVTEEAKEMAEGMAEGMG